MLRINNQLFHLMTIPLSVLDSTWVIALIDNRSIKLILNCNVKTWCYLMLKEATIWC